MPDDDWALGQNEVDVRNEARNPLNAMPLVSAARSYVEAVESRSGEQDGGIALQVTYRSLKQAVDDFENAGHEAEAMPATESAE